MDARTLLRRPSAFLPLGMSLAGFALVGWFVVSAGVVRGQHDEGAVARVFQALMVGQIPIMGCFALRWLPRAPRPAALILALQLAAAFAAIGRLLLLEA
jgi:hypothetical protein